MNSVGAEKDPYLQAYIQARMKNHVEEVKLQKVLANLEVGRRIKKIMLNMELFEDRKIAHKLKREATDLETQKDKPMKKFLTSSSMACFDRLHTEARIFAFANVTRSHKASQSMDEGGRETVPTSSTKRASIYPVTKGHSRNDPFDVKSAHRVRHRTPRHSLVPDSHNGNHVVITVPSSPNRTGDGRRRSTRMRDNVTPMLHSGIETPGGLNNSFSKSSNIAPTTSVRRPSSLAPQMSTPAIRVEDPDETERSKTAATVPMRGRKKATDQQSVRTLPTLLPSQSSPPGSPTRTNRPKTSKLWPGDPNAIRSVRRERKKPEEMLSLVKNGEEARRMIRDMPPTCSKNCSKPDILHELGRSYSDLPNLLPAIEKARHAFAIQEAACRDTPGDPLNAEDVEGEKEKGVMPVSQIQYLALRSMGGVRRNSVIA